MIDLAIAANVILYELPPHTTHRLQPCDVGAFGPLKREWNKRCQLILEETGEQMQAKDVVREYLIARSIAFKPETIRQAFFKSGIQKDAVGNPWCNIDRFTAADFAPSISTSTQLHLSEGFPEDHGDVSVRVELDSAVNEPEDLYISSSEDGYDDEAGSDFDSVSDAGDNDVDLRDAMAPSSLANTHSASSSDIDSSSSEPSDCQPRAQTSDDTPAPPVQGSTTVHSIPLVDHYDDPRSDPPEYDEPITTQDRVQYWKAKALGYRDQRNDARGQRDHATAHAILCGREVQTLKTKMNAKAANADKQQGRLTLIGGHVVTTSEGRQVAADQKQAKVDKLAKTALTKQKKDDEKSAIHARRQKDGRDGMLFSGALQTQKRAVLADVAWTLGLEETGTRDDLISRINVHFKSHPDLRESPRYHGLFKRAGRPVSAPTAAASQQGVSAEVQPMPGSSTAWSWAAPPGIASMPPYPVHGNMPLPPPVHYSPHYQIPPGYVQPHPAYPPLYDAQHLPPVSKPSAPPFRPSSPPSPPL